MPEPDLLHQEILDVCRSVKQGVLKLQLTRGGGGRGYSPPSWVRPTRVLSLHPLPLWIESRRQFGIRICLCQTRLGINPALAGIKHCNRLEQILAQREWMNQDIQEGLMCDSEGYLVEGTMTNLFWIREGILWTPMLNLCGVAGIARAWVITQARKWELRVREVRARPAALMEAEEVFLTNSVVGVLPVVEWLHVRGWPVGAVARRLQRCWP